MSDRSHPSGAQPCPICRKPAVEQFRPFCSKRCADVDLGRWLSDVYVVPGRDDEEEDERQGKAADEDS
jgi:uncharacterized protein